MPDLLLELFSEEIPARMQRRAAEDLRKLVTDALVERGFVYEGAKAYATPRRLALHVVGLPAKGRTCARSARGRASARPSRRSKASSRAPGSPRSTEARIEEDPKKGEFYVAGSSAPAARRRRAWPKSCRPSSAPSRGRNRCAGARPRRSPGRLRWVRPLHAIVCTFGPETEAPEIVPFAVDGIRSAT